MSSFYIGVDGLGLIGLVVLGLPKAGIGVSSSSSELSYNALKSLPCANLDNRLLALFIFSSDIANTLPLPSLKLKSPGSSFSGDYFSVIWGDLSILLLDQLLLSSLLF